MWNVKYVPAMFAFYDRTGIEHFLEKQAAHGWHLEETGAFIWKFRRGEVKTVHYAVTYHGKCAPDDPAFNARMELFAAYCAHGGWELAADNARMQIFCSEEVDPTPIETDALIEVENIHKAAKKGLLYPRGLNILTALLLMFSFAGQFDRLPISVFLSGSAALYALCLLLLLAVPLTEVCMYLHWYRTARRAAKTDGSFVPTRGTRIHVWLHCILLIVILLFLICLGIQLSIPALVFALILIVGVSLIIRFSKNMRENGYPALENRVYTILLISGLIVADVIAFSILAQFQPGEASASFDAPLHLYHLTLREESCEECSSRMEDALFASRGIVFCGPKDERLVYHVIDLKAEMIRSFVLDYYLRMYEDSVYKKMLGEDFDPTFRETDAQVWGAEAAYYLYRNELGGHMYILCYDGSIVYLSYPQMLTAQQMQTVAELLGA